MIDGASLYPRTIDPKGRIALPARLRSGLGSQVLVRTLPGRVVTVEPLGDWDAFLRPELQGNAYPLTVDALTGRIHPPAAVRRYAGWQPGADVTCVGVPGALLIVNPQLATPWVDANDHKAVIDLLIKKLQDDPESFTREQINRLRKVCGLPELPDLDPDQAPSPEAEARRTHQPGEVGAYA